jgi:hypothetical protein
VGHGEFLKMMPGEFERRVVNFFDANIQRDGDERR